MSCARLSHRSTISQQSKSQRCYSMEWTKPDFEEVSLSCEINCYVSAEL